jgi:formylglycine-generating enzyme required for sulfatase activity
MERSVFISYSSNDKAAADQICAALEGSGFGCWIAPRDIEAGTDYPAAILAGLQQARTVVVVVSPASVASPHILTEVGHAFSKKKPIIPVRLSATELPPDFDYFLSMSQWLDAHEGLTAENLARLKEAVSQSQTGRVLGAPRKAGLDKRILVAGAVLLMAVAVFAVWRRPSAGIDSKDAHSTDGKLLPPGDDEKGNGAKGNDAKGSPPDARLKPWVNPKDGLTYAWIPPGQFTMGCSAGDTECKPDEAPSHLVELPAGFWIGQTEVTNAAYSRIVTSANFPSGEANLPAVEISWHDAKSYCAAIGGRLPTEAEWEYAARGGATTAYYGVPSKIAWYAENAGGARHPVAAKQPNGYGLYDILGNASEWVLDRYFNKYDIEAPAIGDVQQPLASNASALTRGGFWESEAPNIRVSHRIPMDNRDPAPMAGIRCVVERK